RQVVAGDVEVPRLVQRVGGARQGGRDAAQWRAGPDETGRALPDRPAVRAEVVLHEVVREQLTVVAEADGDPARPFGVPLDAGVDAAAVRSREGTEVAGGLAGVDQLAALVEVVPHGQGGGHLAVGDL